MLFHIKRKIPLYSGSHLDLKIPSLIAPSLVLSSATFIVLLLCVILSIDLIIECPILRSIQWNGRTRSIELLAQTMQRNVIETLLEEYRIMSCVLFTILSSHVLLYFFGILELGTIFFSAIWE